MVCLICFLMVLSRRVRKFRVSKTHWKMNLSKTNMLWHKGTKWTMCEWIYLNRPLVLQWVPTPPANIQQAETSFVTVQSAILLWTMRVGVAHLNRAQSTSLISPPPNPLSPRQKTFHNLKVTSFLLRGIHASCSHPPCLWWDAVFPMRLFLPSCLNELHLIPCLQPSSCLISLSSSLSSKYLILPQITFCEFYLLSSPQKGKLHKSRDLVLPTQEPQALFSNGYLINIYWVNINESMHDHSKGLYSCLYRSNYIDIYINIYLYI